MKRLLQATALVGVCISAQAASAATIEVLWTSGTAAYDSAITSLAAGAGSYDPDGDGSLDWNLTLWDGTSDPGFSDYDVMVVGSTCNATGTGNCGGTNGFYNLGVSADGVLAHKAEIAAAAGNRTMITGQDADWHLINRPGAVDDGPRGFLINAVNWAASGTGMGVVALVDRIGTGTGWLDLSDSFLSDSILPADVYGNQSDIVNLGAGQEDFPINEGLTSGGLSRWGTSSHSCFGDIDGYTTINIAGQGDVGCGVTLVSSGGASGGTDGGDDPDLNPVPLPASAWLLLAGLAGLFRMRRTA